MIVTVIDTETAGLDGGVCDLAIVEINERFEVINAYESLLDPERPISPEAMGVHHITEDMVRGKPTLSEYVASIGNPFDKSDLILAGHNCVTPDHEVRTKDGWVPFSEIKGDTVDAAVWDPVTQAISFEECPVVRKPYVGDMLSWDTQYHKGAYTPEHRIYFSTPGSSAWRVSTAMRVSKMGMNNVFVPVAGEMESGSLVMTPDEVEFMEMCRADGSQSGRSYRFHFKKQEKILRCQRLMALLSVPFSVAQSKAGTTKLRAGACDLVDRVVALLSQAPSGKGYGPWLLDLSLECRLRLLDSLRHWDGARYGEKAQTSLSTICKQTAYWLSEVATFSGYSSKVTFDIANNRGFSRPDGVIHRVTIRPRSRVKLIEGPTVSHYSGTVFCLTTPTGAFLVRRKGTTWVTGNCQFDIRMVREVLPQDFGKLCTLKLSRNLWPDLESFKLQSLRYRWGLAAGDAHRAMGDVVTCISLMRFICQTKGVTLGQLVQMSNQPLSLDSKLPFGKHRGVKLRDVPKSYLSWALREMKELDPDLRAAFQTLVSR